jgi:gas vesicle protein
MGFLDWLFGRKKPEEIEERQKDIDLASSKELLQKRIDDETNAFWSTIEKFHSDLKSKNEGFESSLENLKNAVPTEKIDEQILKIADTSRENFIAKMSAIKTAIKKGFSHDIHSFSGYYNFVVSSVNDANMKTVKEYMSLDVAFKKETNDVVDKMREVKKCVDDFKDTLNKNNEKISSFEKLLNDVKFLEEKNAEKMDSDKKIEHLKKDLDELNQNKNNFEKELEELGQSEIWKSYIQLTKDKEITEGEMRRIIEEVVNIFASVDRVLKRFVKFVEDENISFKNMDLLKRYVESPFDAFAQDTNLVTINSALTVLEQLLAEKKIKIDNSEESLKIINNLKSSKLLDNLSKKYSEVNEKIKKLKEQVENHEYVKRKSELQNNISKAARSIEDNKKTLEHQEKFIKNVETEIQNMRENLKNKLKEI